MSDTEARGFLEDILAHPDDDTPRLVYADWLEERGDPRGAFIRTQVELARAPLDDPRRPEWEFRVHDLLEDHEEEWLGPAPERVQGWQFYRGFVDALEIEPGVFRAHSENLFRLTRVRHLRPLISGAGFEAGRAALRELVQSEQAGRLEVLDLSGASVRLPEVEALGASPFLGRLEGLDLGNMYWDEEVNRSLIESPLASRLRRLSLAGNGIRDDELSALAGARFPRLEALDLSGCSLEGPGLRDLASAPWLPQLTVLHLGGSTIPESSLIEFLGSPQLGRLAVLNLTSHGTGQTGTPILTALVRNGHLSGLSRLCLDGNPAEPHALHDLVAAPTLGKLAALRLNRCDLRPAGLRLLLEGLQTRAADGHPGLRALGLGHNRLGTGVRALAGCPALADLVALELHNNGIRDADVEVLAKSSHLGRLTTLDLANNAFGLRGVQALAASPTLGSLSRLNLGFTAGIENAARWALSTSAALPWLLPVQFAAHYGSNTLEPNACWWAFPTRLCFRHPAGKR